MKKLLYIIIFLSFNFLHAQTVIPNFSFEDWQTVNGKNAPANWQWDSAAVASGGIKMESKASNGSKSIRLGYYYYQNINYGAFVTMEGALTAVPAGISFDMQAYSNGGATLEMDCEFYDASNNLIKTLNTSTPTSRDTWFNLQPKETFPGTQPVSYKLTFKMIPSADVQLLNYYTLVDNVKFLPGTTTGIEEQQTVEPRLYPIPAANELFINYSGPESINSAVLVSMDGKRKEISVNGQRRINISSFANGMYFIELYNSNTIISRQKLVVAR
jgi:hypothetical protein